MKHAIAAVGLAGATVLATTQFEPAQAWSTGIGVVDDTMRGKPPRKLPKLKEVVPKTTLPEVKVDSGGVVIRHDDVTAKVPNGIPQKPTDVLVPDMPSVHSDGEGFVDRGINDLNKAARWWNDTKRAAVTKLIDTPKTILEKFWKWLEKLLKMLIELGVLGVIGLYMMLMLSFSLGRAVPRRRA